MRETTLAACHPVEAMRPFLTVDRLDDAQRARWARLRRRRDRDAFVAARVLASLLWSCLRGRPAHECRLEQRCQECGGPHGRPHVRDDPDVAVAWSHSGGLAAAIVGPGPVAVDVETGLPPVELTGGPGPSDSARRWTTAECWTKAGYTDLAEALHHLRRGTVPSAPRGLPSLSELQHRSWTPAPVEPSPPHSALCLLSRTPTRLVAAVRVPAGSRHTAQRW